MNIEKALEKLFSLHQLGIKLGLDKINHLLDHLGNPQRELKAIHIAGSNGKGSTASFIASILTEAGYKTGLYTSPHFTQFNERVRINGEIVSDSYVARFVDDLNAYIDEHEPTFFELTTALAFKYFAEQKVDYAVIETGLGGRLDATNTLNPLGCVFTTITHEHTNILGNDLKVIAGEKAGIIKKNIPVCVGLMPKEAVEVFQSKAKENSCQDFLLSDYIETFDDHVKISIGEFHYTIYDPVLRGVHQFNNAALAILALNKILGITNVKFINRGIANVKKNSGIQGRYEIVNESPRIIIDAAHNTEGVNSFINEFKKEEKKYRKKYLIFSSMRDKNFSEMLSNLAPHFDQIYATTINYERAAGIDELIEIAAQSGINIKPVVDPAKFINEYKCSKEKDCLVLLGSIYMLGNVKIELDNKKT